MEEQVDETRAPWWRRWQVWAVITAVLVVVGAFAGTSGGGNNAAPQDEASTAASVEAIATPAPAVAERAEAACKEGFATYEALKVLESARLDGTAGEMATCRRSTR